MVAEIEGRGERAKNLPPRHRVTEIEKSSRVEKELIVSYLPRWRSPLSVVLHRVRRWACLRLWIRLRVREGIRRRMVRAVRRVMAKTQAQNRQLQYPQHGRPVPELRIRWGRVGRYRLSP